MAKAEIVRIPLKFGRQDQVSQRHAPFGVLSECQNLRFRKDGRLSVRNGYNTTGAVTNAGTLTAYDLFEHQGRLCATGSDFGDGFPVDVFELTPGQVNQWRGSDVALDITLNPFTNPREVAGVNQVGDGVAFETSACGSGYVALAWRPSATSSVYVLICRQDNRQIIHYELVSNNSASAQVAFAGGTFYVQLALNTGDVVIKQFTPGSDIAFATYATHVSGGTVATHDLVAVTNPSTARVCSAVNKSGTNSTTIKVYNSAGAQVGATATVTQTASVVCVDADQTDNTINLYSITGGSTGQIRTFNLTTGALTLGPTATTVGGSGMSCRLPALGAFAQAIAVAVNDGSTNVAIQLFSQSAHTVLQTFTVQKAIISSRLVNGQSGSQKRAVVFAGIVAPAVPSFTDPVSGSSVATNAIFYVTSTSAHMSTRDLGKAIPQNVGLNVNLSRDTTTGRLCWGGLRTTQLGLGGTLLAQPVVTLLDFQSKARRQTAQYAGLTYFAGATVQVYDGTFPGELLFNEQPGIYSATPAAGGGLSASAQYTYVHHWEYTRADGSLEQSGLSLPFQANTGVAQTQNTLVVSSPHTARVARGDILFGGSVVSVLSRTVWDSVTGTTGSDFRRCSVKQVPASMANYGASITHIDQLSDAVVAKQAVVYTQGARAAGSGPLPHDAPRGCAYIAIDASRMVLGGLAAPHQMQVSKGAFLSEPFEFSEFSTFFSQVARPVTAIVALDAAKVPFTTEEVYAQFGDGPDDQGGGALSPPQEVPTASGLKDWRSILKYGDGVFFQAQDTQIYRLPRGAGSPVLAAAEIEDLLRAFPTISAACKHKADTSLIFACNNTGLTSARLAVLDLPTNQWTTDLPPLTASSGVEALVNFGDTMAYISGGVCYIQSASTFNDTVSGSPAFIPTLLKTKPIYPFGIAGKGLISGIMVCGEYANDVTWNVRVSLDDGLTFTTLTPFAVTAANGYAAGARVRKLFTLPQAAEAGSVVIEYTSTTAGTTASEQTPLEEIGIEVQLEGGFVNLDPADLGSA